MTRVSFNNRFIVEPYISDRALKATQGAGFALIAQKVNLKGLKLLVDVAWTRTGETDVIPAGSKIFIREEMLHTQPWAKQLLECEGIEGKFIIVESQFIEMIEDPE